MSIVLLVILMALGIGNALAGIKPTVTQLRNAGCQEAGEYVKRLSFTLVVALASIGFLLGWNFELASQIKQDKRDLQRQIDNLDQAVADRLHLPNP